MTGVRVMAEYESFPLWLDRTEGVSNVDPSDLGLNRELAAALLAWADEYDRTFDPAGPAAGGFASPEAATAFNARGRELTEAVVDELGPGYGVRYVEAS